MADQKISQLTELSSADNDDVLAIVDTSAGETKKIQKSNLIGSYLSNVNTGTSSNITGLVKGSGSALGAAAAGTDYIAPGAGNADASVTTASDTAAGKVELATIAETSAGSDSGRAVTPDGLAGSVYGKRVVQIKVIDDATALTTGDGKVIFVIPSELNGYNLVDADAMVSTVSSSGTPTYQIRNVTDAVDMLSTRITVDANETTSYTAATAPVIDATHDDVATGDLIAVDKDVAGTGEKGDTIVLTFQLP